MSIGKDYTFVTTVPAKDYQLIKFDKSDGYIFDTVQILSFLIYSNETLDAAKTGVYFSMLPVTYERVYGPDDDHEYYAIVRPDGKVDIPWENVFDGMEDFIKFIESEYSPAAHAARLAALK